MKQSNRNRLSKLSTHAVWLDKVGKHDFENKIYIYGYNFLKYSIICYGIALTDGA